MANSSTSNEVGNRQSLSLRRSQKSNTNLRRSDPTPNHVDNKIPTFQKDYQLNVNKAISKKLSDQEQEYLCPVCNGKADKDTIECESCDHWFHYSCVGLTKGKVNKIDPNVPYICNGCNENELYNDDRTSHLNLGILSPLAKAHENQPSGSSIKTSTTEVSKPNLSTMRKSNPILSNHSNQAESVNDQMSTKEYSKSKSDQTALENCMYINTPVDHSVAKETINIPIDQIPFEETTNIQSEVTSMKETNNILNSNNSITINKIAKTSNL
ncbi:unnamed protein product [Mytilus coruscus]|uniref:PHD-type domain-containing protein n=1 Tax=Mytilus coruscus TaxID=42192 RepID=A0A6J8C447_MYTCO|nr:unnamed protein product [Mytilus coruscus]